MRAKVKDSTQEHYAWVWTPGKLYTGIKLGNKRKRVAMLQYLTVGDFLWVVWQSVKQYWSRRKFHSQGLDMVDAVDRPVPPENCVDDGACMVACPTNTIFLMIKYDPPLPQAADNSI